MVRNLDSVAVSLKQCGVGSTDGRQAMAEMYEELSCVVEQKVKNYMYVRNLSNAIYVDMDVIYSYCLWEGVLYAINTYDSTKGEFVPYYLFHLDRNIERCIRKEKSDKSKGITERASLDIEEDEEDGALATPRQMQWHDRYAMASDGIAQLVAMYANQFGAEKADLAFVIVNTDGLPQDLRTRAICKAFGVDKYTASTRKKVERTKKHFLDFCRTVPNIDTILTGVKGGM